MRLFTQIPLKIYGLALPTCLEEIDLFHFYSEIPDPFLDLQTGTEKMRMGTILHELLSQIEELRYFAPFRGSLLLGFPDV